MPKMKNPSAPPVADPTPSQPVYAGTLLRGVMVGPLGAQVQFEFTHPAGEQLRDAKADAHHRPKAALDALADRLRGNDASTTLATLQARLTEAEALLAVEPAAVEAAEVAVAEAIVTGRDPAEAEQRLRDRRHRLADLQSRVRLLTARRDQLASEVLAARKIEATEFAREVAVKADQRRREAEAKLAAVIAQAFGELEVCREEARAAGHLAAAVRDGRLPWLTGA